MAIDIMNTVDIIELLENYLERVRPPENIRSQVDVGYKLENQSVILMEIRPVWNDPATIREYGFAKATYVKNKDAWKIFWMRSDLKWHSCEPAPQVEELKDFLKIVDEDKNHCFKG